MSAENLLDSQPVELNQFVASIKRFHYAPRRRFKCGDGVEQAWRSLRAYADRLWRTTVHREH